MLFDGVWRDESYRSGESLGHHRCCSCQHQLISNRCVVLRLRNEVLWRLSTLLIHFALASHNLYLSQKTLAMWVMNEISLCITLVGKIDYNGMRLEYCGNHNRW